MGKRKLLQIFTVIICLLCVCGCKKQKATGAVYNNADVVKNKYLVCIDAGHGFGDPGCESDFLNGTEAKHTLDMANFLKIALEKKGITVILTHNGSSFPECREIISQAKKMGINYDNSRMIENNVFSAYERVIWASVLDKQEKIDLMLSLHLNSIIGHPEVNRYELYYYEKNPSAYSLSELCQALKSKLDNDTYIEATKPDVSYTVTRYTSFPSLLLEAGHITNSAHAQKVNSDDWKKEFCETLADEIEVWLNTYSK